MFETTSEGISVKDNKSQKIGISSDTLFLPSIDKKPISRASKTRTKQITKQILALPSLKLDSQPQILSHKGMGQNQIQNVENKSQFAMEVEQKLKLVLGQMKELNESNDSDEIDFQEKIHKNKEILKQHRKKQQSEEENKKSKKTLKKLPPKSRPAKNRNQSLYEKRAREYKDQSSENKAVLKKKLAFVKEKQSQQGLKQLKSKDYLMNKPPIAKSSSKKNHSRALSQKPSQKDLGSVNKSVNLFDNIQNYLENPDQAKKSKEKDQNKKQLVGLSLKYARRDLEDKLKVMEEKLGIKEEEQRQKFKKNSQSLVEMSEWRKIQLTQKLLKYENSTFEKEIQRIGNLQERTSQSLEKYLDHQKLLLDIGFQKQSTILKTEIKAQ